MENLKKQKIEVNYDEKTGELTSKGNCPKSKEDI